MALPNLVDCCGFEEGGYTDNAFSAGSHDYTDVGGGLGVSFIAGRHAGSRYAMRVEGGGGVKANGSEVGKVRIGSGWLRHHGGMGGNHTALDLSNGAGSVIGFDSSSRIFANAGGGVVTGPTVASDAWVHVAWFLDTRANPTVLKWRVDLVAQTDATWATATWTPGPYFYNGGAGVGFDYDDFVFSRTEADHPLGKYKICGGFCAADGAHNVGSGDFEDESAVNFTNGSTTAWTHLDDPPNSSDWISQRAGDGAAYLEFVPTQQTLRDRVDGVYAAVVSRKEGIIGDNQFQFKILVDGALDVVYSGSGQWNVDKVNWKFYPTKPLGGRWSQATVNAMRYRLGYMTDVSPSNEYWTLFTEQAFAEDTADLPIGNVAPNPRLLIEYFTNDPTTFGPSQLDGIITDAVNVGWSWYSRRPAKAFFTLRQNSIHNVRLLPLKHHIRIWFVNETAGNEPVLVYTGRLNEPDSSGQDVIWSVWNYLADLSLSRSGYRVLYPQKKLGTEIALPEWTLARTAVFSILNHVATGTIEDPLDTGGAVEIKTDTRFGVIDVPRLLLMFDLTEIGRANTINNVVYEISREPPHVFNFWKNRGSPTPLSGYRLHFPGNIRDYRHVPGFASLRNDLATIGATAAGGATEVVRTDEVNAAEWGRRQDVFSIKTLAGLAGAPTEQDAQAAITARAVKEATVLSKDLMVDIASNLPTPNETGELDLFLPFRLGNTEWDLEDTVRIQIKRGKDNIDTDYRIVGIRGLQNASGYHGQLFLTLPTA